MMNNRILLTIVLITVGLNKTNAQQKQATAYQCYFTVGQPVPEHNFTDVANFGKKQANYRDFRGKWLILDFWNKGCPSCIGGFPRHNAEQIKYKDKVQFLLVGEYWDEREHPKESYKNTTEAFEMLQHKLKLQLPSAFDSTFIEKTPERPGDPFLVVIDPDGIVRGSGNSLEAIGLNLETLTLKDRPILHDYYREKFYADKATKKFDYTYNKPFLVEGNGGPDSNFIFRSMLSKMIPGTPRIGGDFVYSGGDKYANRPRGRYETTDVTIRHLYRVAYIGAESLKVRDSILSGQIFPIPIFEVHDTALLQTKFAYSMIVPPAKASRELMMRVMQDDLQHYFGYTVTLETRKMPCWVLTATEQAKTKLKASGGKFHWEGRPTSVNGLKVENYPIGQFIYNIANEAGFFPYESEDFDKPMPCFRLLNETGIDGNINITVDYVQRDIASFQKTLRENGLDMVPAEREMKVLVVRDAPMNARK